MKNDMFQPVKTVMIFAVLGFIVFNITGCGRNRFYTDYTVSTDSVSPDAYSEYREKFEKIRGTAFDDVKEESAGMEQWKKDYLLLLTEFMAGGFTTTQNLDFLNKKYPTEYYRFCLEDLNNDKIPELLLGYGYNGAKPEFWEIFKTGSSYDDAFVGTARMYDRETGLLLDGYPPSELNAYRFDGNKLVRECEYYVEQYGYEEDEYDENLNNSDKPLKSSYYVRDKNYGVRELSEEEYTKELFKYSDSDKYKFHGKRLNPENLSDELGVSTNACMTECAYRAYLGILHYLIGNAANGEKDKRYALIEIDHNSAPEMAAFGDNTIFIWFYQNGRLHTWHLDAGDKEEIFHFAYYPRQNVVSVKCANLGDEHDNYITIRNEIVESLLSRALILNVSKDYYVDDIIADKDAYESSKQALFDVYELENAVRFEDTDHLSFDGMMHFLEKKYDMTEEAVTAQMPEP